MWHSISQVTTEKFDILYSKLIAGIQEFFLSYLDCYFREPSRKLQKNFPIFVPV
jgi:hypothetical protein